MNERRSLFSDYGGDYASYYRNSGTVIPNIVVVLNDFSGFAEQYEDFQDDFTVLSRDGVKYGIYFAVSATGTNAIRYRTQQNFRVVMTLQLNDATDYSIIVGKTDGLIPSAYKGRGLVAMDRVYEFQTAYAMDSANLRETIIEFCDGLAKNSDSFAKSVPILPDTVDCDFVGDYIRDISRVPVGVEKSSLNISFVNLTNKVVLPVVAQELPEMINFAEELSVLLSEIANTTVIDPEEFIYKEELSVVNMDFDEVVKDVFAEMVERHNSYKDGRMEKEVLAGFDDRIYVILGYKRFYEKLSADSKDKLNVLLEKAEEIYKIHFVIFDTASQLQRQIVKDFFIKFTKNLQKRCQKHRMAPDTSFDRLHFSVQQVFAEIRIVWQLVDIWLPAPLDFGQFQRVGCFQCMIVARHIQNIHSNIIQTPAAEIGG